MYKFRSDLMRDFIDKGYSVVVVAPFDEWSQEIKNLGCKFIALNLDRKGLNPFKDFLYILKLTRLLISLHADVTLAYTIKPVLYGSISSWLAGVPNRIAITTGLGYTFSAENWINTLTSFLYKISLKFATQVWFLNPDDLSIFIEKKLVHKSKTFILPGEGVDVDYFKPIPSSGNAITFTLISRMLWDKGVGIFAECAKELKVENPQFNFLLVGPVDLENPMGISLQQLETWSAEGFLSYLGPSNDVRTILKDTTCLIHPTYYKEGLPRILMEANSMGIASITTDIPGCRDVVIDGKNGFLVPPNDKPQLKKAILKYIELDELIKKEISILARDRIIRNYSSKIINSIYHDRIFQ